MFEVDNLAALRQRVQDTLVELSVPFTVTAEGNFMTRSGSAATLLTSEALPFEEIEILRLTLSSPVLSSVARTPELFETIASELVIPFGRFEVVASESDPSKVDIVYSYSLFGNFVTAAIISSAFMMVNVVSDMADDEMQRMFGGTRFNEG